MSRARVRPLPGGFTLLELLLAMAITAVIMVLIFGTFRMGIRVWERGERDIERRQRTRIALEMMIHQLNALSRAGRWTKAGSAVALDGTDRRLSFVSALALHPGRQMGLVYVQYRLENRGEGVDLYLLEMPVAMAAEPPDADAVDPADQGQALMTGMHAIAFGYLAPGAPGDDPQWTDQWDPLVTPGRPLAIAVQVTDHPEADPVRIVVPLRADEEG